MTAKSRPSAAAFRCLRCGACCRQPGPVRLSPAEADAAAAALGLPSAGFIEAFTRLHPDRHSLSLTEKPDGSCSLLDDATNACRIQSAKPRQCVEFPWGWRFDHAETICAALRAAAQPTP